MKKFFFLILVFLSTHGLLYGQSKELIKFIIREIQLNANISPGIDRDSCYYSSTLLKFEIDNKSKLQSIQISENAETWLKEEIAVIHKKINVNKFDSLIKKENLKKCTLVFPVLILYDQNSCRPLIKTHNDWFIKETLFYFNGNSLKGNLIFCNSIRFEIVSTIR